ncbi:MAG: class I poly(R)-hydroxyalkanoic acid synthase [Arenicellales bacterium]|nr:class I poly(R)-hydroxyalkanoic acid synthase [Arenicellales bacterium]MDP6313360.1 class I poly(R)-hydroxyalkanoic acid synthase [Arenicellales bacterium]MDP7120433.1 class I poly(R)-hydroxyalkanoic acid synthase [Arenicellales bacterium]MDP7191767.1 class I poly(R)-hydroxyalkanoic acid synthase [Arenicellales bacterium]MDP7489739.1 class I poly(R)-hydroxyalkanoic acid synthase [Arenicellales bacterium]
MSKAKPQPAATDPAEFSRTMVDVMTRSQQAMTEFMQNQTDHFGGSFDPVKLGEVFLQNLSTLRFEPEQLAQAQWQFWQDTVALWQQTTAGLLGRPTEPVIEPDKGDKRFRSDNWSDGHLFDFIKQSYLLTSRYVLGATASAEGLDDKTRAQINFFTRQYVDAMAPTNFALTNPDVLKKTLESKGENLVKGFQNILEDLERGEGRLQTRMVDTKAFELGKNIAVTPGKVVLQNDLIQLLQYQPTTATAYSTPLLIIPPWINKYYILDLQPENSLIRWLVEQGHTVFVISWVNPGSELADKGFEDYLLEGPLAALDAIATISGQAQANVIGYCLGGTLLAALLAYLQAQGDAKRVASSTFFTSMINFSEPGDLGVFINEEQVESLEQKMARDGYLDGTDMAATFNMLRSNDLIWSFVIKNYLMGHEPLAFDLLYWNSDSTRLPARMHSEYLRTMYLENRFKEPGGMVLDGVPIDISSIKTPCYFLSASDDHIAPWPSTFAGATLFQGPVKFVLAGSGHIAGVINPPAADKYCYWTSRGRPHGDADTWLEGASCKAGSWWPNWQKWVAKYTGARGKARQPGAKKAFPVIEDAPGSYASLRLDDG